MDRHMNLTAWCIVLLLWLALGFSTSSAASQADRTAQTDQATQAAQQVPASAIITESTTAIGYAVGGPTTKVDLKGSELTPDANGWAKVQVKSKVGRTNVEVEVKGMKPPSTFGAESSVVRKLIGKAV